VNEEEEEKQRKNTVCFFYFYVAVCCFHNPFPFLKTVKWNTPRETRRTNKAHWVVVVVVVVVVAQCPSSSPLVGCYFLPKIIGYCSGKLAS
jgi:hypothetical protein